MKILPAAFVAATLLAGSSAVHADAREKVSLPVTAAGVDFADPEAVARFRAAAARQIAAACNPDDRVGADLSPDFKCRREMAASIEPKVRQLVMTATNNARMATN